MDFALQALWVPSVDVGQGGGGDPQMDRDPAHPGRIPVAGSSYSLVYSTGVFWARVSSVFPDTFSEVVTDIYAVAPRQSGACSGVCCVKIFGRRRGPKEGPKGAPHRPVPYRALDLNVNE